MNSKGMRPIAVEVVNETSTLGVNSDGSLTVRLFELEVARGNVTGVSSVNKFGEAPDGVQTTATDIWSRANSTPTQQVWLAPTAARIHAIASTSDTDGKTGSPTSAGARTVTIYGLKTWDLAETSETVTLDGTTPVNTANSYVIIHRMKVASCGASGPNVGTITATAEAPDSTVTAVILPTDGQTEMAIYGVPSIQTFYMCRWTASIDKSSVTAATVDLQLKVNEFPQLQPTVFIRKQDMALQSTGVSALSRQFCMPLKIAGPCIIKVQGIASTADTDCSSSFDGMLINN